VGQKTHTELANGLFVSVDRLHCSLAPGTPADFGSGGPEIHNVPAQLLQTIAVCEQRRLGSMGDACMV
jgi:hypothetical protein